MVNPTYLINIHYQPSGLATSGRNDTGLFIAIMPEVNLSATGTTYELALSNLLVLVDAAPNSGNTPLSSIRTW